MTFVMLQIFMRQQNLRNDEAVRGKKFFVNRHESRLADGGAGLFFREICRTRFVAERAHARSDRAAGDDDDFFAGFAQRRDLRDDLLELSGIDQLPAVGEDASAEFHHEARSGFK